MWTGAILAGGQASRLGGIDKGRLAVGPASILERQLELLGTLTSHVMIVTSNRSRCRGVDARVVEDRVPGTGALGGLYTALVEATTEQVLVLACDMPFLTTSLLRRLADRGANADVAVPRDRGGRHPLCASYQRRVAPELRARIDAGELRVGAALDDLMVLELGPDELEALDPSRRLLLNVNTTADYARAQASAR